MAKSLTKADLVTIAQALNHAIDERDSLADAYAHTGPEAQKAAAAVKAFEALYVKLFGEPSGRQRDIDDLAKVPLVTIYEISKRGPDNA